MKSIDKIDVQRKPYEGRLCLNILPLKKQS